MKTASSPLRTLIESGKFCRANLYTLTLIDGTVLRTTDADIDLPWGGNTFRSETPVIVRDRISTSLGFEVDALNITVTPRLTDTLAGVPWGTAVRSGILDGATFLTEKAYLADWGDPTTLRAPVVVGTLHGFEGNVSDIDGSSTGFKLAIKSALELLATEMPRNLFQSTCTHNVYDPGCTLSRATFTLLKTVTGGGSLNGLTATGITQTAGYFDQGVVAFTSGTNNGLRRTVKAHTTGGVLTFALPLKAAPVAGDAFTIYPVCRRLESLCDSMFSNKAHFKGYPFVPQPETVA